jgi:hypothetical protein
MVEGQTPAAGKVPGTAFLASRPTPSSG